MSVSVTTDGSQTATLNTDHTLVTQTGPTGGAVYQLRVDAAALVNGERLILTLRTRARTSGTTRAIYRAVFDDVQSDPIKDSPAVAVPATSELVAVLRQERGTGRAFPWALLRLDG
jgi:hypothetical protein